jgi:hypothetical protein
MWAYFIAVFWSESLDRLKEYLEELQKPESEKEDAT